MSFGWLRAERELHGRTWRFRLTVSREAWDDLFDWNYPDTPRRTGEDALAEAPDFWRWLVQRLGAPAFDDVKGGTPPRLLQMSVETGAQLHPFWTEFRYRNNNQE